jgi:hypothetical protein
MKRRNDKESSMKVMAAFSFTVLWTLGLFTVLEVDLWSAKIIVVSLLPTLSVGLDKFFN